MVTVLNPRTVVRHVARVDVDGLEITNERMELLEELSNVGDGWFGAVLIRDREEGKLLESLELAFRSNRGSYHAGKKLVEWLRKNSNDVFNGLAKSQERAYKT